MVGWAAQATHHKSNQCGLEGWKMRLWKTTKKVHTGRKVPTAWGCWQKHQQAALTAWGSYIISVPLLKSISFLYSYFHKSLAKYVHT